MNDGAPAVLLLRCAGCGGGLEGDDGDRAWICPLCRAAFDVRTAGPDGPALAAVPLRSLALGADGDGVALPFWRVSFTPRVEAPSHLVRQALEAASSQGRAWVRAFWMVGAFNVGDPGQQLTQARFDETLTDPDALPAAGVRVSGADALRLAELFVLAAADRNVDVTGASVTLLQPELELVLVTFRLRGREIASPVGGTTWRRETVPDLRG